MHVGALAAFRHALLVLGTRADIAPDVLAGVPLARRGDLYALGGSRSAEVIARFEAIAAPPPKRETDAARLAQDFLPIPRLTGRVREAREIESGDAARALALRLLVEPSASTSPFRPRCFGDILAMRALP